MGEGSSRFARGKGVRGFYYNFFFQDVSKSLFFFNGLEGCIIFFQNVSKSLATQMNLLFNTNMIKIYDV